MADVLELMMICSFVLGMAAGSLPMITIWWCCRREDSAHALRARLAAMERQMSVERAKRMHLPDEVYVSKSGKAYHLRNPCHGAKDMVGFQLCQHCLKEEARAHYLKTTPNDQ